MRYYSRITLAALRDAQRPLSHRDLVALLDPDGNDRSMFNGVGLALTRLSRAGLLTREKVRRNATQNRYFVYRVSDGK